MIFETLRGSTTAVLPHGVALSQLNNKAAAGGREIDAVINFRDMLALQYQSTSQEDKHTSLKPHY